MGALFPLHTSTAPGAGVDESDEQALNAVLLALEEVNQRGVGGKQIALHVCDTSGDAERTKTQATWMVNEKQVAAVLTAGSSQTLTASSVTIPKNVLTMSYSGSSTELTGVADTNGGQVGLLWRTSPSDAIQGSVIAHKLLTDSTRFGTPAKVAILYVDDPYGQGLYYIVSDRLNKASKANRGILVRAARRCEDGRGPAQHVRPGRHRAGGLRGRRGQHHQGGVLPAQPPALPLRQAPLVLLRQREGLGPADQPGGVRADPGLLRHGSGAGHGSGLQRLQRDRFLGKYSKSPDGYAYISNAYDAMYLLALGAAYSQSTTNAVTGPKMAEALTKVSATSGEATPVTSFNSLVTELVAGRSVNVEGASGKLDFDANGEAPAPVELWQVKSGAFITAESNLNPP